MGSRESGARGALGGWGWRLGAALVVAGAFGVAPAWSATHSVGTLAELNSAVSSATNGDLIEVTRDNTVLHPKSVPAATQQTFAATAVTMNSATISGEVTSGLDALTVALAWGTWPSTLEIPPGTAQSLAANGATKSLSLSLSGLRCKTTYHYASYMA